MIDIQAGRHVNGDGAAAQEHARTGRDDRRRTQRRIEELVAALEDSPDLQARIDAGELMSCVLDVHGAAIARLLAILADTRLSGQPLIEMLAADDSVSAMLLLHGLHPDVLSTRVRHAVAKLRPLLGAQGALVELVAATEDSVHLRLSGEWNGRKPSAESVRDEIEAAIFEMAPEVTAVEIDGLPDPNLHPLKFVPSGAHRERVGPKPAGVP